MSFRVRIISKITKTFKRVMKEIAETPKKVFSSDRHRLVDIIEEKEPTFKGDWDTTVETKNKKTSLKLYIKDEEKIIPVVVKNYGRGPMFVMQWGFPIKLSPEDAANTLERLRGERREWAQRFGVSEDITYFSKPDGTKIYNPLSPAAEIKLITEGVIIRKTSKPVPPKYFLQETTEAYEESVENLIEEEINKVIRRMR